MGMNYYWKISTHFILKKKKDDFFHTNLVPLSDNIIDYARNRSTQCKVQEVSLELCSILKLLDPTEADVWDANVKSVVVLALLPYLLNIAPSDSKKKSQKRPFSRAEIRDSYFL